MSGDASCFSRRLIECLTSGLSVFDGDDGSDAGRFPRRPSLPPAFLLACVSWCILAAFLQGAICFGLIQNSVPEGLNSGEMEFELLQDAKLGDYGYSAQASVCCNGKTYEVLVTYAEKNISGDARLLARERVRAKASFSALSETSFARYAASGLCAKAKLYQIERLETSNVVDAVVDARAWARSLFDGCEGKGAALMRALLLADKSKLEQGGLYDDVKAVGLAHMVAVSGAHLSVVAALVALAVARVRVPRKATACLLCVFYVLYAVFTGLAAPVVRAAIMAAVASFSIWGARRSSTLSALGVCVMVMLAVRPANALSLSFFLSAASTCGIVLLAPLLTSWFGCLFAHKAKSISEACALTTAANMPILPVTLCVFSRLPLLSPVANILAAPVIAVLLPGGLLALVFAWAAPQAGLMALSVFVRLADWFCALLDLMASLPFASLPIDANFVVASVASAAIVLSLWYFWPQPSKRRVFAVCALGFAGVLAAASISFFVQPDRIVALNVGQGDAILLQSKGHAVLVDTGNNDTMLASALGRAGANHLDALVITHHDDDHCGSMSSLQSNISGSSVYLAGDTFKCSCDGCKDLLSEARKASGRQAASLVKGDKLVIGRFTCEVVWPESFADEGGNADSLCLLVSYDFDGDGAAESRALLVGDAEAEQIDAILKSLDETVAQNIQVFKAGHHGSKAGMTDELAQSLSSEIALVSCGANNRYGHPATSTVEALQLAGTSIFRTDTQGDISCVFGSQGISVHVQNALPDAIE